MKHGKRCKVSTPYRGLKSMAASDPNDKIPGPPMRVAATHVAVLRCQTWHVWPDEAVFEVGDLMLSLGSGVRLPSQFAVQTYLGRSDPAKYTPELTHRGPLLWTGSVPDLYTVRDTLLKAPEDTIAVTLETRHAHRGEVDLLMAFVHPGDVSDTLAEGVRSTLFALMSLLNLQLGELLTPAEPIQIRKFDSQGDQFASTVRVAVRDRKTLAQEGLQKAVQALAAAVFTSPNAERLRTALELYGSHFFERQARTRFLLLVMALEVLAVPRTKHQVALTLLDRWKSELMVAMAQYPEGAVEHASLEALHRELLQRRDDSIRSQIRFLFRTTAEDTGQDAGSLERRALRVYDARSTLVHDGFLHPNVLSNVEDEARVLLEQVLNICLRNAISQQSSLP